ncbi:MAG: RNA polymerase sigma factor [Isosphaeraceae bacterium]
MVQRYGPPIHDWFLKWRVQPHDAADLVQEVFVRLVRRLPEFRYDDRRSFRAYLKTLARYAWCDLRERSRSSGSGEAHLDDLEGVEARDDLERRLEEQFDHELLNEAMALVASRVTGPTWEAFRLQAIEGVPAAEVAQRLAMKIASVYKARSNVVRLLQETVRDLEYDPQPGKN